MTRSPTAPRQGFTLVELLVVIAIIGVLVGLLLPAVQQAREAARRCSCANNLTQLGLALHNHEFSQEAFPPGVTGDPGPIRSVAEGRHVGWIVRVLPFLEQQALARHFDEAAGAYAEVNAPVRRQRIQVLVCPSDPLRVFDRQDPDIGHSTYAGAHASRETPIDSANDGVLFLDSRIRFGDIEDGSSNTLLVAEHFLFPDDLGWVSGTRSTLRNTSRIEDVPKPDGAEEAVPEPLFVGGLGSYHPGGIQVSLADGATRFVSRNVSPEVLRQLGARSDGELPAENGER
ncbi:MAG: DUF1559 domain-containing protein [Planctomycetes bacterium]|nr:DUF1559 domain-containing protein [Planctomycetota bacterium]